ncbi:MAG: zinc-ribbon domain-containing protein [Planctomycetota bacterium]|nr:zinc-ribbon domain-containing protein [Planctomycetota bacterium]MDA1165606.1 zinc-ribbon domain-containing protein [Planctomycetota bacterium]MQC25809.1 zinc-ribbon domain-containing protein [Chloroflexota bacterium]
MTDSQINCTNCETELPGDAEFCFNCGHQLSGSTPCRTCQTDNPPGSQFCQQCGKLLPSPGEPDPLDDFQEDLKLASRRLDAAEQQNVINRRELDLYTDEKRASKEAETQQQVNESHLEKQAEHDIHQHERDTRHEAQVNELERQAAALNRRDKLNKERSDRAREETHEEKKQEYDRRREELGHDAKFKQQLVSEKHQLEQAQRENKRQQLDENQRFKQEHESRDQDSRLQAADTEQQATHQRANREFEHGMNQQQSEFQNERQQLTQGRSEDLDYERLRDSHEDDRKNRKIERAVKWQEHLNGLSQAKKDASSRRELDTQRTQQDIQTEADRATHEMDLKRMAALNELSPETLIAMSPAEQSRLLADLRQTEALKDLTEEQILARAAEKSPEVAQALAEKYRAAGGQKSKQEMKELYERMLNSQQSQSVSQMDSIQKLMQTALETQRDTAVAAAQGGQPPAAASVPTTTYCPQCRNELPAAAKFCGKCGTSLT